MAKTISESIDTIRESFVAISETAKAAQGKFLEEGEMYFYAKDKLDDRGHTVTVTDICNFFTDKANLFSDTSVLSAIRTEIISEEDKAMQDYALSELPKYIGGRHIIDAIKNTDDRYYYTNDIDKKAFKHINDEVRIVNSDALKSYKASMMNPNPRVILPTTSREDMEKYIIEELLKKKEADLQREIISAGKTDKPRKKIKEPKFVNKDIARKIGWGVGIAGGIAAGRLFDTPGLSIAIGICGICGGVGGFILSRVFEKIADLINGAKKNSYNRKQNKEIWFHDKQEEKVKAARADAYAHVKNKYADEIRKRIEDWEARERAKQAESDARVNKSNEWYNKYAYDERGNKISKGVARENYYREIARIAATSAPILTTLLEQVDTIEKNLNVINKEYNNIIKLSGAKNIGRDALTCYYMIHNGEVSTYEQAIQMKKNLDDANCARANYAMEQERKRAEEERKHQEWLRQYRKEEAEKAEKARLEYQRKMEEYDRRAAERQRTLAIAAGALAVSQKISEQNEILNDLAKKFDE